jgi:hypothetical protein
MVSCGSDEGGPTTGASCGDGACDWWEDARVCPQDCGTCGNGQCDSGEDESSCPADCGGGGGSGGGAGGAAPDCHTGEGQLPQDLVEIAYDGAGPYTNLTEQPWSITIGTTKYVLAEQELNEAVRFELEHPARVFGFKLQWAGLPENGDPEMPLEAGLYPDFGYNGFDFWPEAIWSGTRCLGDAVDGQWLTYALPAPVEVSHPGLVYVAHRHAGPGSPVWLFDSVVQAGAGCEDDGSCCNVFDDCQSAMNLPEVQASQYYNGVSFSFQYHYLVRLLVEYTDDVTPEEKFFQPVPDLPANGHVSWGDYDEDGWDDLLLGGTTLMRNNGDGTFTDVSAASGIAALGIAGTGGVWGDYDNDGCMDLFVFAESPSALDSLLHSNCDGTFSDATSSSGIAGFDLQSYNACGDPVNNIHSPAAAAAWIDIDSDSYLDLYLANYECGADMSWYSDNVYHNNGDGTFSDWSGQYGFSVAKTPSRCLGPIDHDRDGDVDLLVGNYRLRANLLYQNNGDGTVTQVAADVGLTGTKHGSSYGHTIGLSWGDLDNDGSFDVITANLAHPRYYGFSDKTEVLLNDGTGHYHDISGDWSKPASDAGLRYQETHSVPALADFNQDGNLDLVITSVYEGRPTDFYWGNGDGTFQLDAYHAGITTENGWGLAVADYDHDGDPDLYASSLFRNDLAPAAQGHWLQVRAIGNVASNRAAIGATVEISFGADKRIRHVQGGTGKGGQDSLYLHFGLGMATEVSEIRVRYPAAGEVVYAGPLAADQRVWVYEDGSLTLGWTP